VASVLSLGAIIFILLRSLVINPIKWRSYKYEVHFLEHVENHIAYCESNYNDKRPIMKKFLEDHRPTEYEKMRGNALTRFPKGSNLFTAEAEV